MWQARAAVIVVGLTGVYMLDRLDIWWRFTTGEYWWMHAMLGVWTVFVLLLLVLSLLTTLAAVAGSHGWMP